MKSKKRRKEKRLVKNIEKRHLKKEKRLVAFIDWSLLRIP